MKITLWKETANGQYHIQVGSLYTKVSQDKAKTFLNENIPKSEEVTISGSFRLWNF